jgi:hypothetical protein
LSTFLVAPYFWTACTHHCSIAGCDRHTPLLPLQQRSERLVMTLAS